LVETCKLNGIDPQVLTRIANAHPINRIDEILPWAWALDELLS
jgi:hypothetical protein